jgi:hypothetical protein
LQETGGPDLDTENTDNAVEDLNLEAETTGEVKTDPEAEKAAQEPG